MPESVMDEEMDRYGTLPGSGMRDMKNKIKSTPLRENRRTSGPPRLHGVDWEETFQSIMKKKK